MSVFESIRNAIFGRSASAASAPAAAATAPPQPIRLPRRLLDSPQRSHPRRLQRHSP